MSKPLQLKRYPQTPDVGQPAATPNQGGDPKVRGSSLIPPATTHSSHIQISQGGSGYRSTRHVFPKNRYIGASTLPSNKASPITKDKESESQTMNSTGISGAKSTGQQYGIRKQSPFEKKDSKGSNIPQRKSSQQIARSASSISPSDTNVREDVSEDARQIQRKLLQLHVLHSASAEIQLQWRMSAKVHFQKRFEDLVERHVEIADIAHQTQELRNQNGFVEWCRNIKPSEIERRVHTLSKCIEEIYGNLNAGSKYHRVISSFEAWFSQAQHMRESRESDKPAHAVRDTYVEEIGAGWQNDVDALQRSLSTLTGDLRTLGSAPVSSSLGKLLILLQDLVIDMLAEVDCIRSVEYELMVQEEMWIEAQIENLSVKVHRGIEGNTKTPSKRDVASVKRMR